MKRSIESLASVIAAVLLVVLLLSDLVFDISRKYAHVFRDAAMIAIVLSLQEMHTRSLQYRQHQDPEQKPEVASYRGRALRYGASCVFIAIASLDLLLGFSQSHHGLHVAMVALWMVTVLLITRSK